MGEILVVIALLSSLKWILEEGLHQSLIVRGVHTLLYVLFIAVAHTVAMNSSLTTLEQLLYTPEALQEISLVVMLDLLYVVYLCTRGRSRQRIMQRVAAALPSLLFFPTLFYIRLRLFYLLPGYSFVGVTMGLIVIVVGITLLAPKIGQLLTLSLETSRELSLLLSLALFLIVVAAGALHPDSQVRGMGGSVDWAQVGLLLLFVFVGALLGFVGRRVYPSIRRKLKL